MFLLLFGGSSAVLDEDPPVIRATVVRSGASTTLTVVNAISSTMTAVSSDGIRLTAAGTSTTEG